MEPRFETLCLLAGSCLFLSQAQGQNLYKTPIGGLETVHLADGSRVTLNTDTTIRVRIGRTRRRVELDSGEAYFSRAGSLAPVRPFRFQQAYHRKRY